MRTTRPLMRSVPVFFVGLVLVVVGIAAIDSSSSIFVSQTLPSNTCNHNCRFWGIVSESIPAQVSEDHLSVLPYSIRNLSVANASGWAIVYFDESGFPEPEVFRGQPPAHQDPLFDAAVAQVCSATPQVAVAHVRNCGSGLCDIPNPHPFERIKNGTHWFMGHNGIIDKDILLQLIRPDYLAENPPQYGENEAEWIDSDLYFIYLLQMFEDYGWQVKLGLGAAVQALREAIPGNEEFLNIVLTDGTTVWGYREGDTLFHIQVVGDNPYSAIASRFPSYQLDGWTEMVDGQLITLQPTCEPVIEDIEEYFPVVVAATEFDVDLQNPFAFSAFPNPFNPRTTLEYTLQDPQKVEITIYSLFGRRLVILVDELLPSGSHRVVWDGRDQQGNQMPSGTYFCRLQAGQYTTTKRMMLIK